MNTISAKELIALLKDLPPNAPVAFTSDYGDRVHTRQVHFLEGEIEETPISENAYSDSGYAVEDEEGEDTINVYIIS